MTRTEVDTLAAELRRLIDETSTERFRSLNIWQRSHHHNRIEEIKYILAVNFGGLYGWKLTSTPFTLGKLSKQTNRNPFELENYRYPSVDHRYFYRELHRPYKPAALAVHLYNWPDCFPDVAMTCSGIGLTHEVIEDYPSWWYPGATTLIVYTPLSTAPGALSTRVPRESKSAL